MPRYFFVTRDGVDFIRDEEGVDLDGIETAQDEATRGVADLAKDALPGAVSKELSVEVRDGRGDTLLRAMLRFEVAVGDSISSADSAALPKRFD